MEKIKILIEKLVNVEKAGSVKRNRGFCEKIVVYFSQRK